jgi:hypothetical protein
MHTGDDDSDGWWLARIDLRRFARCTACGGSPDELLAGGRVSSSLAKMRNHRPQVVVLMIGTNDASANRTVGAQGRRHPPSI